MTHPKLKRLTVFLLCCAILAAQTATFSPQGAAILKNQTGQRIPGIQIVDVLTCSPVATSLPNGFIYQTAVANGFSIIGPSMGSALVSQKLALDWKHFLVQFLTDGAIDAAVAGVSGVISMPTGLVKGLVIGHAVMDKFSPQLLSTAPTSTALIALMLDPSKSTQFTAPGCSEGAILATYSKGARAIGPVLISSNPAPVALPFAAPAKDDASETAYAWMQSPINTVVLQKIMAMHEANARDYERFYKGEF